MSSSLAPTRARKQQSRITNNTIWTPEEDQLLIQLATSTDSQTISWSNLAKSFPDKTAPQLAGRWSKVLDPSLIKGSWTQEEDETIKEYVLKNGEKDWSKLALLLKGRTGKQCRERFKNHLDPSVLRNPWTDAEDQILMELHQQLGNQWTKIASMMKGRSDNCVKNRWNSTLKKRIDRMEKGQPLVMKRGRKPKGFSAPNIPKPEPLDNTNADVYSPVSSPLLNSRMRGPVVEFIPITESLRFMSKTPTSIQSNLPNVEENRLNLKRLLAEIV